MYVLLLSIIQFDCLAKMSRLNDILSDWIQDVRPCSDVLTK